MKNWKTSLLGFLAGGAQVATVLSHAGLTLGHWGGTDFLSLFGAISTVALGLYAKDHNVTGGSVQQ